jgi:hypothetical protein
MNTFTKCFNAIPFVWDGTSVEFDATSTRDATGQLNLMANSHCGHGLDHSFDGLKFDPPTMKRDSWKTWIEGVAGKLDRIKENAGKSVTQGYERLATTGKKDGGTKKQDLRKLADNWAKAKQNGRKALNEERYTIIAHDWSDIAESLNVRANRLFRSMPSARWQVLVTIMGICMLIIPFILTSQDKIGTSELLTNLPFISACMLMAVFSLSATASIVWRFGRALSKLGKEAYKAAEDEEKKIGTQFQGESQFSSEDV